MKTKNMITFGSIPVGQTLQGDINLNYIDITGEKPGPTICLVAGIHGDETASVMGLQRYLSNLRYKMTDNGAGRSKIHFPGRIVAFPTANIVGLSHNQLGIPDDLFFHENTNRGFPGDPGGSLRDRLAEKLFSEVVKIKPDLVVDLHTGHARWLPYSIIDWVPTSDPVLINLREKSMEYARKFGFVCCSDLPAKEYSATALDTSFSSQILAAGIPSFTVEVPGGRFAQRQAVSMVDVGISVLVLGTIYAACGKEDSCQTFREQLSAHLCDLLKHSYRYLNHEYLYQRISGPRANKGGFFRELSDPGDKVRKGGVMGEITNWRGDILEIVRANTDGVVSGIVDATRVKTGDLLFELLVDLTEDAERLALE